MTFHPVEVFIHRADALQFDKVVFDPRKAEHEKDVAFNIFNVPT